MSEMLVLKSRIVRLDIAFPQQWPEQWHSVSPREWTPSGTFVSLAADLRSQAPLLRKFSSCATAGDCPFVDVHNWEIGIKQPHLSSAIWWSLKAKGIVQVRL